MCLLESGEDAHGINGAACMADELIKEAVYMAEDRPDFDYDNIPTVYHARESVDGFHLARKLEPWIRDTALKLHQTHSTGWEPITGLNFILEPSGTGQTQEWNWDLEGLWRTTGKYKKQLQKESSSTAV
jgi:hypothetical protein